MPSVDTTTDSFIERRVWSVQTPPFRNPLPYSCERAWASGGGGGADLTRPMAWRYLAFAGTSLSSVGQGVYNTAYSRLVDRLGSKAELGVTLAQRHQAGAMIEKRASQLGRFGRELARRNPVGALAHLGFSLAEARRLARTRYRTSKTLADLWLEFWFGWKPLVTDIHNACEVLDRSPPPRRVVGTAGRQHVMTQTGGEWAESIKWTSTVSCRIQCDIRVVDENLHTLQQAGLLNPAVWLWDSLPWSFVVDWFINVSSWLGSFSDFAGLEVTRAQFTQRVAGSGAHWWGHPTLAHRNGSGHAFVWSRTPTAGVPPPTLSRRDLSLKPARALTALSLLVQQLPR